MSKKRTRRWLSLLLAVVMLLSMLPAAAFAVGSGSARAQSSSGDDIMRIVHLDAGRKYFSVQSVKTLIDAMDEAGYTHLELAFGNDGLRFLLDDMSIDLSGTEANGLLARSNNYDLGDDTTTRPGDDGTAGEGDDSVDGDTTPPTEEVVPPVEETIPEEEPLPIEPIVEEPDQETYFSDDDVTAAIQAGNAAYQGNDGSAWTEDEMSEIISYAGEHGIEIIPLLNTPGHMDAILDAMAVLGIEDAAYQSSERTIDVTNKTAVAFTQALVQKYVGYFADQGCTYFNMGADEYANDTGNPKFSELINNGGYDDFINYINTLAAMIKDAGMRPMAFNDGIYYDECIDFGEIDTDILIAYWSSGWSGYDVASASFLADQGFDLINTHGDYYWILGGNQCSAEKAAGFNPKLFMGEDTELDASGAMFCIWCDVPDADSDDNVIDSVVKGGVLDAMAEAMGATPELPADSTVTDPYTAVSVSAPGLTGVTVSEVSNPDVTIPGVSAEDIVAYDIIPMTDSGNYTGEATVSIPVSADWTNVCGGVLESDNGAQKLGIEGTLDNGTFTFTVPHFSTVVVYDAGEVEERTISVVAGGTATDTIDGANYAGEYQTENPSIATVTVTGNDGTEERTDYEQGRNIRYNQLLNYDSSDWVRAGDYYYQANDGNYYPLYAKRSSDGFAFWYTYTYTWGYSETGSSDNVTQIGHPEETDSTRENPNITVYYVSGTTPGVEASTTVTFTAASDAAGKTTQVTIGNVRYTINVIAEDLSRVDPLTIEYWITNAPLDDDSGNHTYTVEAVDAYGEEGTTPELPDTLPREGSRRVYYWHNRMLNTDDHNNYGDNTGEQTIAGGDDETTSGVAFTSVRYYQGQWEVYTENNQWVPVEANHQLVAYYLEYTQVTDEVDSYAADWGKRGDGSTTGYIDHNHPASISYQVVYEDGSTNPANTTADALASKTMVLNQNAGARGVGTLMFEETAEYEILRVTAETGEMDGYDNGGAWGTYQVTTFDWDDNEETVWEGESNGTVSINNNSNDPNTEGAYANLAWGGYDTSERNKNAILIRIYVRTKVTEDSLTVHYIDQTSGIDDEFYSYNIAVSEGTLFNPSIGLNPSQPIGPLDNGTVININDVEQTVTSDLGELTEIGAEYRGQEYECTHVSLSQDQRDVYLYYNFTANARFVVDFGLPLQIKLSDLGISDPGWTITRVTGAEYGRTAIDAGSESFTYTLTSVLNSVESLDVTLTWTDPEGEQSRDSTVRNIYVYPASNVLYEDTFLSENTTTGTNYASWTHTPGDAAVQEVNNESLYGYDAQYASSTGNSLGSAWTISGLTQGSGSKYLTTEFYGNGFDLIGTAGPNTGYVYLLLQGEENKLIVIDTSYTDTYGTLSQVPLAHVELDEGEYTANIRAAYRAPSTTEADTSDATAYARSASGVLNSADVYADIAEMQADGFVIDDVEYVSVADTLAAASTDSSLKPVSSGLVSRAYTGARQAGTTVTIDGFRVYRNAVNSDFDAVYDLAGENVFTYVNILDAVLTGQSSASFSSIAYVEGDGTNYTQADYEANGGPQNELYLQPGAAVVIGITEDAYAQVSARAVSGNATMTIALEDGAHKTVQLNTNTEMYYAASELGDSGVIVVANTGSTLVALGNLKVLNGNTQQVTESDLQAANVILRSLNASVPVDPEDPDVTDPDEPDVEEPETPVFTPDKLDVKANSVKVLFNKLVTVTVNASTDVDKLTVNGKTVQPANSLLVKLGLSKDYTYVFMDTVNRNVSKSYEVIAYNADGVASEVHTVQG